jgi:hypothetical protein
MNHDIAPTKNIPMKTHTYRIREIHESPLGLAQGITTNPISHNQKLSDIPKIWDVEFTDLISW